MVCLITQSRGILSIFSQLGQSRIVQPRSLTQLRKTQPQRMQMKAKTPAPKWVKRLQGQSQFWQTTSGHLLFRFHI
jgi:hypothetical protein